MKAIVYSIKPHEKELLSLTNKKRHDLTMISNELNHSTLIYASGKEAVIVSSYDILGFDLLRELKAIGVKKIITRSISTTHIDLNAAKEFEFNIANVPSANKGHKEVAEIVIKNLNLWEDNKCVGDACCCKKTCSDNRGNDKSS